MSEGQGVCRHICLGVTTDTQIDKASKFKSAPSPRWMKIKFGLRLKSFGAIFINCLPMSPRKKHAGVAPLYSRAPWKSRRARTAPGERLIATRIDRIALPENRL